MELLPHDAYDINNNDSIEPVVYWKEPLTPEMKLASILIRLATHVLGINEEDLLNQLPLQTECLRNWCPLSGGRRNAEDELLKQEVRARISEYQALITQINTWKEGLQSIKERVKISYKPTLISELEQLKVEYLTVHSMDLKDKRTTNKDSLITKSSNRITSDKLSVTSSGGIKLNISSNELKLILICHDTTQKQFEDQFKTFHGNTTELKDLKKNLDSQFQDLQIALSSLAKEYSLLHMELYEINKTVKEYFVETDYLNEVTTSNNAVNNNVIMDAEPTRKQISRSEYLEFNEDKQKTENSSIYKHIQANVANEHFDRFIEVFKDKMEEASVSYDNLEQVKLQVYYWEKIPNQLKKSSYISLMNQARELIQYMQEVIAKLEVPCNEMSNDFVRFALSNKVEHLNSHQSLFKELSTDIIDPLLDAVEDESLERESFEEVKKKFQGEISDPLWNKIYEYSQQLIETAFDVKIGLLPQRFASFHLMKNNKFVRYEKLLTKIYFKMDVQVKSFKEIWEIELRKAFPALKEPESWFNSSKTSYIDFIDLSKNQVVQDALKTEINNNADDLRESDTETTPTCIVS